MEKIGDILKREKTPGSTSEGGTGIWSSADSPEGAPGGEVCPVCRGIGWVSPDVPYGHPDFGKALPCSCVKGPWEEDRASRLKRYSNLGPLTRLTFENLIPQGRSPDPANQKLFGKAYETAKRYAEEPRGWLVLTGSSGSGKTHLAAAIANRCIERGIRVFFMIVPDLLDHLRATFAPGGAVTFDDLFEQVRTVPLLVLDDLGTQSSTPWASEKLFQVLNHRFNAQLPTIVTTNAPLDHLDDSLRSRLTDEALSTVLQVQKHRDTFSTLDALWLPVPQNMTFESFKPGGLNLTGEARLSLEGAFRLALSYAESLDGWLVLMGYSGRGKTHLAAAVGNYQRRKGTDVLMVMVSDLLDYLRFTFRPESTLRYDELFIKVRTVPLLILDDYGEHEEKPWAKEKLYQIINHRYNARLPLVLTTQLSVNEMDPHISSRLADPGMTTFYAIEAPSYTGEGDNPPVRKGTFEGGRGPR